MFIGGICVEIKMEDDISCEKPSTGRIAYSRVMLLAYFFCVQQHIAYMLSALYAIARLSVRPSVHHMGGSVRNGRS